MPRLLLAPVRPSSRRSSVSFLASAVLLAGASSMVSIAHADLLYTFDAGKQGFTVNEASAGQLSHEAGGYLRIQDSTDATNVSLIFPREALGPGWLPYLGGTLSFDARLESPIDAYWPEFGTVNLFSTLGVAAVDVAPASEPGLGWKTYSVKLDPAAWSASPEGFSTVLANLQQVGINLEAGNGAIEVVHIDNIRVSAAVPEPSTWLLSGMGLACVGLAVRRRRPR